MAKTSQITKIRSISVRNVRGVREAVIEPQALTLLLGHNGEGKTTVAASVQYVLQGYCRYTQKNGNLSGRLVRHGSRAAEITLETDRGAISRRIEPGSKGRLVSDLPDKDAAAELTALLPRADVLDCMLSPGAFLALPAKDQQSLLFGLVDGADVDASWVRAKLNDEQLALLEDELATTLTGSGLLTMLKEAAYKRRTEANGKRDALQKVLEAAEAQASTQAAEPAADIGALTTARDAASRAYMDAVGALKAAEKSQQANGAAAKAVEDSEAEVARWEELLGRSVVQLKGIKPPERPRPTDEEIGGLREAATEAAKAVSALREEAARVRGQVETLGPQIEAFAAAEGTGCAVLPTVECPLSATDREAAVARAREGLAELSAKRDDLAREIREADTAAAQAGLAAGNAENLRDAWKGHEQQKSDLERAVSERKEGLAKAKTSLTSAQAAADSLEEPDIEGLTEARDEAEASMQAAQAALDAAVQAAAKAEAGAETADDTETKLQEAERVWHVLDALVKRLEPAGLPAEAMAESIGRVLEPINDALEPWGFTLEAEPGAEFELAVRKAGDQQATPVVALSDSEQYRVGVACQVAFAGLTSWPLVVVDGADMLDMHNLSPLLAMLYGSGVRALVTCTPREYVEAGALPTQYPTGSGIAVYWVSGGMVGHGAATLLPGGDEGRKAA